MTSLSEVYEGEVRAVVGRRQRLLAMVLFAAGVTMSAVAILLTTTGLRSWVGLDVVGARAVSGVLAGLGLPAAIVGVFAALPASDETRAAAAIGTSLSVFGVLLFVYAYPNRFLSSEPVLALSTVAIYTLGLLVTFWCLFLAVATFKRRNDPGGAARVEVTDEGTVRLVSRETADESASSSEVPPVPGLGGIGLLGRDPDGDVPTQTKADETGTARTAEQRAETAIDEGSNVDRSVNEESTIDGSIDTIRTTEPDDEQALESPATPEPTSDGGQAVAQEAGTEVISESGQPDVYCGNCAYFEYVEVDGDLDPYCHYHQEFMEDLEACDQWTANTTDE